MSNDKVIDRIKKLLALAGNNPNENEAEVAMKRAHRLLAEHNLDLADMTASESAGQEPYTKEHQDFKWRFRPYGRTIAAAIAELYFCKMFYSRQEKLDHYTFVGRETNVAVAKMISESVCATLVAQARVGAMGDAGFETNFMAGAASRVARRCKAMIAEASEGATKTEEGRNLPALCNTYLAELAGADKFIVEGMGIKLKEAACRAQGGRTGFSGRSAGDAAGASVSLRPGIRSNNQAALR